MSDDSVTTPHLSRRDLLQAGAMALGVAAVGCAPGRGPSAPAPALGPGPFAAAPLDQVRIGFVGVGGMGTVHVRNLARIAGARITAVCDVVEAHAVRAANILTGAGHPAPRLFTRGPTDFLRMCETEDLDLVYTATPWEWHVPICVAAMRNGKHAATEVPAAVTMEEAWQLVEEAEQYAKHCVMMENCNYDRMEMMVLNMVRQGVFGEILHAEGGYLHDLREIKFSSEGEGLWRRAHSIRRNGNLYPTHGLGPVANCLDINRGDRFDYIVSMSGPSRGLQAWAREHFPPDAPERAERYALGDVNVSLIRTVQGKTILVGHNTNLPRPYSRIHLVEGTKGLFQGYPDRVHVEGKSEEHRWDEAAKWLPDYEHPLWKFEAATRSTEGHGGMDFLEDYRLIHCLRQGLPTDMSVYDAAALSAVSAASEASVANRSRPVDIPDFTRGRWQTLPPWEIVTP
ncbi:MAG: Gfo/Idh/MocA family oxidoreductase [Gemmatimonadota bacterium]